MYLKNSKIAKWLNKPFPFFENYQQKILIPTVITLLITIGLILLDSPINKEVLISYFKYALLIISVSIIYNLVLPKIFKETFKFENWNIKKTLVFSFLTVFTIAFIITIAFYNNVANELSFVYLFVIILKRALVLDVLPIILLIFLGEKYLQKKNHLKSFEIKAMQKKLKQKPNINFTLLPNTKDELKLTEEEFLYIKSEANYCFVYYIRNQVVCKKLIRSSLKKIEESFYNSNNILKCHRSFIVNLLKISNVSGNARGYLFSLKDIDFKIPVSRNFSKQIIEKLKNN